MPSVVDDAELLEIPAGTCNFPNFEHIQMVLFNQKRATQLALTLFNQAEVLQAKAKKDEALQAKAKKDKAAAGVQKERGVNFAGQPLYKWLKLEAREAMHQSHEHVLLTTPDLEAKAVAAFYLDTTTALFLEWACACLRTNPHIKALEEIGDVAALDAMEQAIYSEKCRLKTMHETQIVDFITNMMTETRHDHFSVDALRERAFDVTNYLLDAYYNKLPDGFLDEPNYLICMETLVNQARALVEGLRREREEALATAEEKEPDTEEKEPTAESPPRLRRARRPAAPTAESPPRTRHKA